MKTKQLLSAIALAASAIFVPAQAGVLGMGDLAITSLGLFNAGTNPPAPIITGLTITNDSRTGSAASDFNGVGGSGTGLSSITGTAGADVDVKYRCAGTDCGSIGGLYGTIENNTTTHLTGPATKNYSLGDMFIAGSALGATGARGLTRANASATGPDNEGGASATIQNNARVTTSFTANQSFNAFFAMGVDAFVNAYVSPGTLSNPQTFASGSISFNLTVDEQLGGGNQTRILNWSPSQINTGSFATTSSENQSYSFVGFLSSPTALIESGKTYTLVISQASLATVSEISRRIPEPASLALVGIALLGMAGAVRLRRA